MRKPHFFFSLACAFALVSVTASAQEEGNRPFDTRSEPHFGDATVPLREFLHEHHTIATKPQHFCVAGYRSGTETHAWIHWSEGKRIILWDGFNTSEGAKTSIARSRRVLDLRKDIVPTEADIAGSTYRMTRAWANQVIADCNARGVKYAIIARKK